MRRAAKFGVLVLALLIAGVPVMACVLPSAALTAQEKACCRQMANQCGHDQMPSSHSCCKTVSPPDQTATVKSPFNLGYQLQVPGLPELTSPFFGLPEPATFAVVSVLGHSPPQAQPVSPDILRI
jgi:hypothetical protein